MDKKENNQERRYPRFLDNKPCGQDLFEGKSHESVAQNIANIIASNEANIIGIDGGWGSGKSNMVKLVKDKLNSDNYHFFIYDAWGHQTDFQRRSILENLTSFLVDEEEILSRKKWNARLLQLLSRKRSVGSKIVKELSAVAKVSALIAFAMPILVFFNGLIHENLFKLIYWGIILVLSLILLFYLQVRNMKKYGQSVSLSSILYEMFYSYMDYTNEKSKDSIEQSIKYETIYDEEPSTRDFKNWMKDIDKDINNHTLIIVFDNMDRLPREKVQELWSAIHTFFAEEKYDNISVIVPFIREHVKTAFKSEDIILEQQNDDAGETVANENEKKKKNTKANKTVCFGNDFINKTFDAVYRVSPPIMSDWKDYFADRWEEAFGASLNRKVTQIYDLLSDVITPREIVAFINEFVSIKQMSDESIPDEYIALFIKGKDKLSANPKEEILNPTYLGAMDFMYKNDRDLPKYISALYYQLPATKSLDIVYTETLKKALDNKQVEQIKTIQAQPSVFYSILENAITGITNIPNSVVALNQCFANENNEQTRLAWNCVYKREKEQEITKPLQDYQKILIQHISNKNEYLKELITGFCKLQDIDVIRYYDSIRQLSEIEDINPFEYLTKKEVDAESFMKFVEQAKGTYNQYKIVCKQENLNEYLSRLNVVQLTSLRAIPYIKNEYDLTAYSAHLVSLVDTNGGKKENVRIIYERLKEVERPIAKKLPDAQIQSFFSNTKEADVFYYDLVCMRISRLNNFQQNFQQAFKSVLNKTDEGLVEKIAERIEYYISYGDILLNVENMKCPMFQSVAKRLTEKSYGISKINIVPVLQKYDAIKSNLSIDPNILLRRLNELCDEALANITTDNVNTICVGFFEDALGIKNKLTTHCVEIAKQYLTSKTKEEWRQSIIDGNSDYRFLMTVRPNIQTCYDAFKELLVENTQSLNNGFTKDKCHSLIKLFEDNGRKMLIAFNDIRDRFCGGTCTMTKELFDYYGEWLLKYSKLEENTSSLRTIFPSTVLDKKENVQLILRNKETMVRIVEKAGDENEDFKAKIKFMLDSEYKDDKIFEAFANAIGITKSLFGKIKDGIGDLIKQ